MRRFLSAVFSYAVVGYFAASMALADPIYFEISGMAGLPGEHAFLTVLDTKTGPEPAWATRAGVMRVSDEGILVYQPFAITDWGHGEELPNDFEACCPIPGRPNEYLMAESGYYKGRFGRVFHIRLAPVEGSALYTGKILGSFRPEPKPTPDYSTPGPKQFEGIACLQQGDRWVVILGRRGGDGEPGGLFWGDLSFGDLKFQPTADVPFDSAPEAMGLRGCADLLLVERDGKHMLLRVASSDPADFGPFYSLIYETGEFRFEDGELQYVRSDEPIMWWRLDGLKVEALAPCKLGKARYCIGTDDEIYGGAWRPLPPALHLR
jgi:hypothetical protein